MRFAALLLVVLSGVASAVAAESDTGVLQHCVSIAADTARLQCYDAAAGRTTATPPAAASSRGGASPASTGGTTAPVTDDARSFGLSAAQLQANKPVTASVQGQVKALTTDAAQKLQLTLDNGQIWQILDDDVRLNVGDEVSIRRAALGSFLLTTKLKFVYHVRRLR